jgi:hypothetical protein
MTASLVNLKFLPSPEIVDATANTQLQNDNSRKVATTEYVQNATLDLSNKQDISEKNQPNGYAGLDENSFIYSSQINIIDGGIF